MEHKNPGEPNHPCYEEVLLLHEEEEDHNRQRQLQLQQQLQLQHQLQQQQQQQQQRQQHGNGGDRSPESGSLYSDEMPSGYNSGEQYDTLSTGYMSGEAYELPEARMDLREPTLGDVAEEEGHDDVAAAVSAVEAAAGSTAAGRQSISSSSTSDDNMDTGTCRNVPIEPSVILLHHEGQVIQGGQGGPQTAAAARSPTYGTVKNKMRKKCSSLSFAVPIESGLTVMEDEDYFDPESSDAAVVGGTEGGMSLGPYRTVPSDTDTSAFDSDANLRITTDTTSGVLTASDSGAELLGLGNKKNTSKGSRLANRKSKKAVRKVRDEEWFAAHDNKYWGIARVICFWSSILSIVISIVTAAVVIAMMPKNCDPPVKWYQGSVSVDLLPQLKTTIDGDESIFFLLNLSDVIYDKIPKFKSLGIRTLHLKDITKKPNSSLYYPTEDLRIIPEVMDDVELIPQLTKELHRLNMTLMVQIPVVGQNGSIDNKDEKILSLEMEHAVATAIKFWAERGVDGIFLLGLERFAGDKWIEQSLSDWKSVFTKYGTTENERILMTSFEFVRNLEEETSEEGKFKALAHVSLLDATLNLGGDKDEDDDDEHFIERQLEDYSKWDTELDHPWLNWNLKLRKIPLNAAVISLQLLLPGTINIEARSLFDEIDEVDDEMIKNITGLRRVAVPIYMNGNYKRCECESGILKESNFVLRHPAPGLLQLERFYNRRNRYVFVGNFGSEISSLKAISGIYAGGDLLIDTSRSLSLPLGQYVFFREILLQPGHAIVIKLPK